MAIEKIFGCVEKDSNSCGPPDVASSKSSGNCEHIRLEAMVTNSGKDEYIRSIEKRNKDLESKNIVLLEKIQNLEEVLEYFRERYPPGVTNKKRLSPKKSPSRRSPETRRRKKSKLKAVRSEKERDVIKEDEEGENTPRIL